MAAQLVSSFSSSGIFPGSWNRQTDKWTNIKLQSLLHWFQNSKLGGFLGEAEPIQKMAAGRPSDSDLQQLCSGGPISHQGCSPDDQLKTAMGTSGCIQLWRVLAGRQVGIQVLLAPLQVLEVWVRQGAVGRYSFGWIKCQALQKQVFA